MRLIGSLREVVPFKVVIEFISQILSSVEGLLPCAPDQIGVIGVGMLGVADPLRVVPPSGEKCQGAKNTFDFFRTQLIAHNV